MYKTKDLNTGDFTEGYTSYESKTYPQAKVMLPGNNKILTNIIELNKKDYNSFCGIV